ncbi:MAG: aminomethyltransferase beta-barrel domain-containing protein, partial [Chitinophagaceae bacterium]
LDIALGKPAFVIRIHPDTNTVVLGEETDLDKPEMWVSKINWLKYDGIETGQSAVTKIRYRDPGTTSTLYPDPAGVKVQFAEPAKGIAPGQSAVFYEGEDVIGGGIIQK